VASVSDKNGNLLFFSYGGVVGSREKVNGIYQAMPNGAFFKGAGNLLTFLEMIVQSPADSNIYYLTFIGYHYLNNIADVNLYSIQIDMRLNHGFGDVVPSSLQLLRKRVGIEKLTAALHHNNRDTWVVAGNRNNDSLIAVLLTPNGFQAPVVTGLPTSLNPNTRMKASPNSEMIAVYASDFRQGVPLEALQLLDFNRTTGIPTFRYSLFSSDIFLEFYSFAFSPDNSKLYAGAGSALGPRNTTLFQFDLLAGNASQVQQSRNVIYTTNAADQVHDMQLAIDGKIYLIIDSTSLAQINNPNLYGAASGFKVDGINLNGKSRGIRLPTLNQTLFRNANKLQAQADRNVICEGETVQLSAYGAGADKFKWGIANGLTAPSDTLNNPVVKPTVTTTFWVIGRSTNRADTAFVTVTVVPKLKAISVLGPQQVHTYAENQQYSVQPLTSGNKYTWELTGGTIENGQGQSSVSVNWGKERAGTVSVIESHPVGCSGEKVSLAVEISGNPEPVIYNIITPNNDNRNDAFVIGNLKWYPENELKIYNRWGIEVYKSANYQNNWTAEKVGSGVYYYWFQAGGKTWKGWVEVVK
jgi:gliding motility-associated-like protein